MIAATVFSGSSTISGASMITVPSSRVPAKCRAESCIEGATYSFTRLASVSPESTNTSCITVKYGSRIRSASPGVTVVLVSAHSLMRGAGRLPTVRSRLLPKLLDRGADVLRGHVPGLSPGTEMPLRLIGREHHERIATLTLAARYVRVQCPVACRVRPRRALRRPRRRLTLRHEDALVPRHEHVLALPARVAANLEAHSVGLVARPGCVVIVRARSAERARSELGQVDVAEVVRHDQGPFVVRLRRIAQAEGGSLLFSRKARIGSPDSKPASGSGRVRAREHVDPEVGERLVARGAGRRKSVRPVEMRELEVGTMKIPLKSALEIVASRHCDDQLVALRDSEIGTEQPRRRQVGIPRIDDALLVGAERDRVRPSARRRESVREWRRRVWRQKRKTDSRKYLGEIARYLDLLGSQCPDTDPGSNGDRRARYGLRLLVDDGLRGR